MDTQTFITIVGLVLSSGIGLEVVKSWLNRRAAEKKEDRDESAQEVDLAIKIRSQVMTETKVLNDDMAELKKELREVKADVRYWQEKHDKVLKENARMQTQYILMASTLNNVITWLRQHDIEVPFQMPIVVDFSKEKPND